ncbi:GGDEF domain-containing protein [Sneathiella glossodoripedis]|uniref:GGDEF domain-containing protein n=1 Tax=Sneathiella glossodoripedis TaxID=418853 RepID=UPI000470C704|nr:GGDEF domain-containing protein [Sneathiella glossodoripedis]
MTTADCFEKASLNAQKTMALLEDRQIKPIPQNFTIWFEYLSGDNPAINELVNRLISEQGKFTETVAKQIYNEFFSHEKESREIRETNRLIQQSMEAALQEIRSSTSGLENYGERLEIFADTADELSVSDLQETVKIVVAETRAMSEQSKNLNKSLQKASDEIEDLKARLEQVENESLTDPLTGIANRKKFDRELLRATSKAKFSNESLCLVMSDIDHFKKFNDEHGHVFGDQVLKLVATTLDSGLSDAGIAARYGGEEFGIILPNTSLAKARQFAEKLRQNVSAKKLVKRNSGDDVGKITMSFGVAKYVTGEDMDKFVARADTALYCAKHKGRNQVSVDQEAMALTA